ncbi:tyrosine-type recombinase/integrase [Aliarcobacter butzleri]|uniref:tyrosine-type recombinase/integrase n=1 Tax=Aliarcobacter butzleri TaxID=28197 RepID=UPI0021B263A8|nr:integrase arm-type DNA-binding domain-containing protein [Aliarcobacter butzleri]MCT7645390.1 integrase arm-type DNA-binding domain-containing protein [Aliarcobacter butzleri]
MPKVVKPLTDKEIKASKPKEKEYKLSDGQSLYLVVKTNGTKFFRYDFSFENKRKSMSFGVYPEISLSEARILRDKTKELLKQKINPIIDKNLSNINSDNTFKSISEKWLSKMKNEWEDSTLKKVVNVMENHAYPYIGNKPIENIIRTDILNIIDRMNKKGLFGSAEKLISNINRIYKFAVTYNYVEHNIVADIDKKNVIISTRHNHYPAITNENEVKELINDIQSFEDLFKADITTIVALKLAPFGLKKLIIKVTEFERASTVLEISVGFTKSELTRLGVFVYPLFKVTSFVVIEVGISIIFSSANSPATIYFGRFIYFVVPALV